MQISINNSGGDFNLKLSGVQGRLARAVKSAIRRTLNGARQDAGRKIAQRYTIGARAVTSTMKTKISGLSGSLQSRGSVISLRRFKHNPKIRRNPARKGGVYAEVVRGEGGYLPRAFLMSSGGIFERKSKARFPIEQKFGPSAPSMLSSVPVSNFIITKMHERINVNLEHELGAIL